MATHGLRIRRDAPFRGDLIDELLRFPVGVHDDQADALGLVGQLLDKMLAPMVPKAVIQAKRDAWDTPEPRGVDWRVI
jgi:hypothetical protein